MSERRRRGVVADLRPRGLIRSERVAAVFLGMARERFVAEVLAGGSRSARWCSALTSTGNGYFCARGAVEWEDAHDVHYPPRSREVGFDANPLVARSDRSLGRAILDLAAEHDARAIVLGSRGQGGLADGAAGQRPGKSRPPRRSAGTDRAREAPALSTLRLATLAGAP